MFEGFRNRSALSVVGRDNAELLIVIEGLDEPDDGVYLLGVLRQARHSKNLCKE